MENAEIVELTWDDPWQPFFAALEIFPDDFMKEGRQQPSEQQTREGLDDLFLDQFARVPGLQVENWVK
jgi:hypothetical protein